MTAVFANARKFQLPALAITIGGAVLLPVMVHLLPPMENVPMGARLLPAFYAPLLAIFLASPLVALVASVVAPWLNNLLTGSPPTPMVLPLTLELVVFSIVVEFILWRFPKSALRMVVAPIAYLAAKAVSTVALFTFQYTPVPPVSPVQYYINGLSLALPGIVILLILNVVIVRYLAHMGRLGQ